MNRRTFLKQAGLPVLGLGVPGLAGSTPGSAPRRRVLRAAHLTDIHVQPGLGAPAGMAAALRHAQSLADPPDIILFGGDCIGDALESPRERVPAQWDLWTATLAAELRTPAYQCLGNHDIYGWKRRSIAGIEEDPLYGKAHALERLGLARSYYSFDLAGWHFVVLDSMQRADGPHGYIARLDDEQFAWLEADLARTPAHTPVSILSHIPILSAAAFLDGKLAKEADWVVPGAWMHIDAGRIKDLFVHHPNVKVCLSGHLHLVDEVHYLGVRYFCNGAVCGGWWKGPYQEFGPLYAVLDYYDDGTVERQLQPLPGPAASAQPAIALAPALHRLASTQPLVIAHRGHSRAAPENTLPAFRRGIEAGADLVELDYHHSQDGIPIVMHDATLDRTTDAAARLGRPQVRVDATPAATIQTLEAGAWFGPAFAGTRVPLLTEALEVIQPGSVTLIERKAGDAATCARLLQERGLVNHVVVQSFDWAYLRELHALLPTQVLGALGPTGRPDGRPLTEAERQLSPAHLDEIVGLGARAVVWSRDVSAPAVAAAHARGLKVWVYTIDDPALAAALVALGVDGIITNDPPSIAAALRAGPAPSSHATNP